MAVLLRAVNLGPRNKVPMPQLRAALTDAGLTGVSTLLASGNVVVDRPAGGVARRVDELVERVIAESFGVTTRAIVVGRSELEAALSEHPFLGAGDGTDYVGFLADRPPAAKLKALDPKRRPEDRFEVRGRLVFLLYAGGAGRTVMQIESFEKQLGTALTVRNTRTVAKVLAALDA